MKSKKVKRKYSAGGVVYREEPEGTLWLVIKPKGSNKWRLPKGQIGSGETSASAAQREVREEGAVEAEVFGKVGNEKYFFVLDKQRILKSVVFYLMKYVQEAQEAPSWDIDQIDWLTYEEARERLAFDNDKELLEKAEEMRSGRDG